MVAKLRVVDPNGVLVFDSSIHKVMSHILTEQWIYEITPTGRYITKTITHPRIKPDSTFISVQWVSVSANASNYGGDATPEIKYFDGYAVLRTNTGSTSRLTITVVYNIKVYSR